MPHITPGIMLETELIHRNRNAPVAKAKLPDRSEANTTELKSQDRLAKALRENLLRRKTQKRARDSDDKKADGSALAKEKSVP